MDEYVCTLSDELKKIAANELRETEKIRAHGIKALRDWVMENPRIIRCRLDSTYLLKSLRFRKYSIPLSQEAMERHLLFREGLYGYDFFSNLDPLKPYVFEMLERGLITVFPKRDEHKRLTIYIRWALADPAIPNMGNVFMSLLSLFMENLMDDEENQIRGLNYILDLSGANLKQVLIFPIDMWYKLGKHAEKSCLVRHKAFHFLNVHPSIMFLVKFFMKHMSEKLRNRVKLYSTNLADSGIIPMDNLPIEYGGTIPLKTIIGMHSKGSFANYVTLKIPIFNPLPLVTNVVRKSEKFNMKRNKSLEPSSPPPP